MRPEGERFLEANYGVQSLDSSERYRELGGVSAFIGHLMRLEDGGRRGRPAVAITPTYLFDLPNKVAGN